MNLNKSNWIQIICFLVGWYCDTHTHTHTHTHTPTHTQVEIYAVCWANVGPTHVTPHSPKPTTQPPSDLYPINKWSKMLWGESNRGHPLPPPSCGRKNVHNLRKNKLHINIHYYILKTAYFTIHTDVNINLHEDKKKVCCRCFVKELTIIITLS